MPTPTGAAAAGDSDRFVSSFFSDLKHGNFVSVARHSISSHTNAFSFAQVVGKCRTPAPAVHREISSTVIWEIQYGDCAED
jgi:hypothetical protein